MDPLPHRRNCLSTTGYRIPATNRRIRVNAHLSSYTRGWWKVSRRGDKGGRYESVSLATRPKGVPYSWTACNKSRPRRWESVSSAEDLFLTRNPFCKRRTLSSEPLWEIPRTAKRSTGQWSNAIESKCAGCCEPTPGCLGIFRPCFFQGNRIANCLVAYRVLEPPSGMEGTVKIQREGHAMRRASATGVTISRHWGHISSTAIPRTPE